MHEITMICQITTNNKTYSGSIGWSTLRQEVGMGCTGQKDMAVQKVPSRQYHRTSTHDVWNHKTIIHQSECFGVDSAHTISDSAWQPFGSDRGLHEIGLSGLQLRGAKAGAGIETEAGRSF